MARTVAAVERLKTSAGVSLSFIWRSVPRAGAERHPLPGPPPSRGRGKIAAGSEQIPLPPCGGGSGRGLAPPSRCRLNQRRLDAAFGQLAAEAALVVLGDRGALDLIALVEEGDPEGERDVVEDIGVLGPGDDRARRHHGRDVAVDEAGAGEIGERHHGADRALALLAVVARRLGKDDLALG